MGKKKTPPNTSASKGTRRGPPRLPKIGKAEIARREAFQQFEFRLQRLEFAVRLMQASIADVARFVDYEVVEEE